MLPHLVYSFSSFLSLAFKIGMQPAQPDFRHSKLELQAIEEKKVVDVVEGCRQVEADQE